MQTLSDGPVTKSAKPIALPAQEAQVAEARTWARRSLAVYAPGVQDDAVQIVSELFENVIKHAASEGAILFCYLGEGPPVLGVQDWDPSPPKRKEADFFDESGRGLNIVAELSKDWGWFPHGVGKVVWSMLDIYA